MITELNHRRIFLEEKMRLVEEDLGKKTEEKSALQFENNDLLELIVSGQDQMKKLSKKLKILMFVSVVLLALLFCETA